ncbi:class D sortase [Bacillus infantis]|uniref:class D sortase n=1 Tax=Bacillus infantis TaxID=324767 RepID=UPI003CEFD6BE
MGRRNKFIVPLLGCILIISGLSLALFNTVTWVKGYSAVEEVKAVHQDVPAKEADEVKKSKAEPLYAEEPAAGEKFGEIAFPKLGIAIPVFEGADEDQLAKGVGHFSESVLPGENNNSVLSGHRDTVFRRLGEVKKGDVMVVKTTAGSFTYRVEKIRIVDADDRTVIVPKPEASLTVTTCYPFGYIGNAPERFVLFGSLIESDVR